MLLNLVEEFMPILFVILTLIRFSAVALLGMCMMLLPMAALAYDTWAVSEEDPPAACDIGDAIFAATCYGSYCDNTGLSCAETNYPVYYRYWTTNFSEEGTSYRYCGAQQIMTGFSCAGSYCDNVSIECSEIARPRYNCQWIGPYSEEQGFIDFGGKYANGMFCSGSNCDNHWYYVCNF
jgi:hypothetical protein